MRPAMTPVKQTQAAPPRILVVDDSATMRLYITTILTSLGYDVVEADSGAAGFDRLLAAEFDLVVTDLEMSPMTGLELIAAIGLLPSWRRPRLIVCSSDLEASQKSMAPELRRVDHMLAKPFQLHELAGAVSDVLSRRLGKTGGLCGH